MKENVLEAKPVEKSQARAMLYFTVKPQAVCSQNETHHERFSFKHVVLHELSFLSFLARILTVFHKEKYERK